MHPDLGIGYEPGENLACRTAGLEGQLIPGEWVEAAVDACTKLGIKPSGASWRISTYDAKRSSGCGGQCCWLSTKIISSDNRRRGRPAVPGTTGLQSTASNSQPSHPLNVDCVRRPQAGQVKSYVHKRTLRAALGSIGFKRRAPSAKVSPLGPSSARAAVGSHDQQHGDD
jgi:hypothetical protein